MSRRRLRKRRHLREENQAAIQAVIQEMANKLRRDIDAKVWAMGQMASRVLESPRPLGLLRGTVPLGQWSEVTPPELGFSDE